MTPEVDTLPPCSTSDLHPDEWTERIQTKRGLTLWPLGGRRYQPRLPYLVLDEAWATCFECPLKARCVEVAQRDELTGLYGGQVFLEGESKPFIPITERDRKIREYKSRSRSEQAA